MKLFAGKMAKVFTAEVCRADKSIIDFGVGEEEEWEKVSFSKAKVQ